MNHGFSVSFVGLSLTLLLWFCVVHGPRCSAGLPELPVTDNPENFGFEDQHRYPILTIKADGNKYFENDWLPDMNLLSSNSTIQNSDFVLIRADARLQFGEVRKTLEELKKYRSQGIVLLAEREIVEPNEISPFQEYLLHRLYCGF
jgi:biopolymer transport protein ExbD